MTVSVFKGALIEALEGGVYVIDRFCSLSHHRGITWDYVSINLMTRPKDVTHYKIGVARMPVVAAFHEFKIEGRGNWGNLRVDFGGGLSVVCREENIMSKVKGVKFSSCVFTVEQTGFRRMGTLYRDDIKEQWMKVKGGDHD